MAVDKLVLMEQKVLFAAARVARLERAAIKRQAIAAAAREREAKALRLHAGAAAALATATQALDTLRNARGAVAGVVHGTQSTKYGTTMLCGGRGQWTNVLADITCPKCRAKVPKGAAALRTVRRV